MKIKAQFIYSLFMATAVSMQLASVSAFAESSPSTESSTPHTGWSHHDGYEKGNIQKHHHKMMSELNLSEDQKKQMKAAHEKFKTENQSEIQQLKEKHEALKALKDKPDSADQRKALLQDLKTSHEALHEKHKASIAGILTQEQQAKMEKLHQERKAKYEQRHTQRQNKPIK